MVIVETGARLHFGFQNLSLAHERLYGGVGVALEEPHLTVKAEQASDVVCNDRALESYLPEILNLLDVDGAQVTVSERFPRHIGLGSGTQLVLSSLVAIADAYGKSVSPRQCAPQLGRGGRSGVGVATFETGGFVIDAGHPTERFTTAPPEQGEWEVPHPFGNWSLPSSWRFVLVTPNPATGPSGPAEDSRMRSIVERADPGIADDISTLVTRRLVPTILEGDRSGFGSAIARLGRLNGAWYADEQGGVYRPPAGRLIEELDGSYAVSGVGQSSWGPTVYGLTEKRLVDDAISAGESALDTVGVDGTVTVASPRNTGATITTDGWSRPVCEWADRSQ